MMKTLMPAFCSALRYAAIMLFALVPATEVHAKPGIAKNHPAVTGHRSNTGVLRFNYTAPYDGHPVSVASDGGTQLAGYTTLGEAFNAINNGTHTVTVQITIAANTVEPVTAVLNASGNGNALYSSISIQPLGNVSVSGDIAGELIILNGADNLVIDGLNNGSSSLIIENTNTGAANGVSTIKFIQDATNNTISNCTISGSSTINITAGAEGGNIWFSTGSVTGNDNNLISHCNIGPANAGLPVRLIWSKGSTATEAENNSGNTISNCNLYDCFSAASVARMIDISAGSAAFIIEANKFYQTDARAQTTGSEFRAIGIDNATSGNNFLVAGNTIGYSTLSGTGSLSLSGVSGSRLKAIYISAGSSGTSVVSNNIVSGISVTGNLGGTGSSAVFSAIHVAAGSVNVTGNAIGAGSGTGAIIVSSSGTAATDVHGIYITSSSGCNITYNTIGAITAGSSGNTAFLLFGIRAGMNISAAVTISNNLIGSRTTPSSLVNTTSSGTSARITGIQNDGSAVFNIDGNTIANLSSQAPNISANIPSVAGIRQAASSSVTAFTGSISNDTIYALSNTDPLSGVVVTGILMTGSTASGTSLTVSKNYIYSFSNLSTNSFAELRGINLTGGINTLHNNMVSLGTDAEGTPLTNNLTICGIYETGGSNRFSFNSIYIGGTGVTGTNKSYALRSLTTGVTRIYSNNIFHNARSGTGKHYAIQLSGTGVNPGGLTSVNNLFFANGTGGILGLYGGSDRATLAGWQAATGQDASSLYVNPALKNPAGTAASIDLHVDIYAAGTEDNAVPIPGISTDIDGDTRNAATPDIGADEYTLTPCNGANGGTASATANTLCGTGSATLSATGFSGGTSSAYNWEYSNDHFISDVHDLTVTSGYYAPATTGTITATVSYRLKVTCNSVAESAYSNIVTVTVYPVAASILATATTICEGEQITLTENGGSATDWNWSTSETTQSITITPTATTVYSVNNTGSGGCTGSASITIIVNAVPSGVSASSSAATICEGNAVNLFSTANTPSPLILSEDFNGVSNTWVKINNSAGGDFANAAWTLRPDSYNYSGTNATFHSNDNSQFYLSNSDEQGNGIITETILESPAFSLSGYSNAGLSYFHHFSWFSSPDFARVEISNNNGASWATLRSWTSDEGAENAFTGDNISLLAYIGQTVKIRFRYTADFGNYWAIDNVIVTGAPDPNTFAWTSVPADFTSNLQNPENITPASNTVYNLTVTSAAGCSASAYAEVTVNTNATYYEDLDGDGFGNENVTQISCTGAPLGFAVAPGDCNDNNASVNPNAVEICGNGIDDNCNGQTDEGCILYTFYADADQDTYGDPVNSVTNYTGITPVGYVTDNADCNDNNASVNPNTVEICGNGIDDNCNGQTDEGCILYTFYADADQDTYGDPANSETNNTGIAPVGYVSNNTDCNDNNASINPNALEICGNGIDDNCNGQTDEGCTVYTFYRDNDQDNYGNAGNSITNFTGIAPTGYVSDNTDCNDDNIAVNPGAIEICNGIDDDCDGATDETTLQASSSAGTITCAGGTTTVLVSATGGSGSYTGTGNFTVSAGTYNFAVTDTHGCSSVTSGNIANGTSTAPARPAKISGSSLNLCGGGDFTYSVANISGATSYTWTVSPGFSVVQNNGRSAVIRAPASFTSGNITVSANNSCGSSATRSLTVYAIGPNPSSFINGPSGVTAGQTGITYRLPSATGVTYTWGVPPGATITSGQGTFKIRVNFGSTSGNISATAINACGSTPTGNKFVTVNAATASYKQSFTATGEDEYIKAYPNPAQSMTNISFNWEKTGTAYTIQITDLNGHIVYSGKGITIPGANMLQLDVSKYANGMYNIKLITDESTRKLKLYKVK